MLDSVLDSRYPVELYKARRLLSGLMKARCRVSKSGERCFVPRCTSLQLPTKGFTRWRGAFLKKVSFQLVPLPIRGKFEFIANRSRIWKIFMDNCHKNGGQFSWSNNSEQAHCFFNVLAVRCTENSKLNIEPITKFNTRLFSFTRWKL